MPWIIGGVVLAIVIIIMVIVGIYNGLVTLRNRFGNAFAQIDVQLKRRYDLIPNLVETSKAYLAHERQTLEAVVAARNQAVAAQSRTAANPGDAAAMTGLVAAESTLGGTMTKFMGLVEAYPQLKADATMRQLSEELSSTENKVAFARQAFNDAVMSYNTAREVFPGVLIARQFGFAAATPFEIQKVEEREAPKVSFA